KPASRVMQPGAANVTDGSEATLQARLEAEVGRMGPLPPYGHRVAGCFLVLYLIKVVRNPF
ncbi:MAG: hypothetical protein WCD54_21875, partial [Pseudolabrys sp.]